MTPDAIARLTEIAARHGERLWSDAAACRAILSDFAGAFAKREIHALSSAVALGIPGTLQGLDPGLPWAAHRDRLATRLNDELGLDQDLACWSVDAWTRALKLQAQGDPGVVKFEYVNLPASTADISRPRPAAAGRPFIEIKLLKVAGDADEDECEALFEVSNHTALNFTDLCFELAVYDVDGHMIDTLGFSGRSRPGSKVQHSVDIDVGAREVGRFDFQCVQDFSKVNAKYMSKLDAAAKQLLAETTLEMVSAVPAVSFDRTDARLIAFAT